MPIPNGEIQSSLQKKGFVKKDRNHKTFRYVLGWNSNVCIHTLFSWAASSGR